MFTRKTILKKTMQVGGSTLISRLLGMIREMLQVRYLGPSAIGDAFITAFKIPNSLRKIFAEGALSAAFIPSIVQAIHKKDRRHVNGLITAGFVLFEGMVLLICALFMWQAESVIRIIVPGFSSEQIAQTVPLLRILMPFIFFISTSALLAGPLQAVGHFFVPAFSPVLLNIVYIGALLVCLHSSLPVTVLCWSILFGGFVQLIAHLIAYFKHQFAATSLSKKDFKRLNSILFKFLWCLPSISVMEVSLFVDTSFASWLPTGSISLLYYANRFMGIPLGVFGVALSTILLPHFSRVSSYAPKRLHFYLYEAAKLIWWVTVPISLLMMFFSREIFITLFLSKKFTLEHAMQAGNLLIVFTSGLFFFSLNKILLNIFYAFHSTGIPGIIAMGATLLNGILDWLFIAKLQSIGLALATIMAGIFQTIAMVVVLHRHFKFTLYIQQFAKFVGRYTIQVLAHSILFYCAYTACAMSIKQLPAWLNAWLLHSLGFWFWAGPLSGIVLMSLYFTRSYFKIKLYFLDG